MERLWVCKSCCLGVFRSYEDIAINGNPVCAKCGDEMSLTHGSGTHMKETLSMMIGPIQV